MTQRSESADEQITPELLLRAYSIGIFPMAQSRDDTDIHWYEPHRRGIIPLDGLHIARRLARRLKRDDYRLCFNRDFVQTVSHCAARSETWISAHIAKLYTELHRMGFAHSVEVWDEDEDVMIGGLYGVALGGAFFGESMFSHRSDASKIALVHLVQHLNASGFSLLDTQYLTSHLQSLGGIEIPRDEYQTRLRHALEGPARFPAFPRGTQV